MIQYDKISPRRLSKALLKNGFKVFSGAYNLTLAAIRSTSQEANKFDDVIFALYHDETNALNLELFPGTTDPGLYWLQNPMRQAGTAIMVANEQYRSCYQLMNNGHKGYRAFKQVGKMKFVRDNNQDSILDFALNGNHALEETVIGANIHRATAQGASINVNKWSAACQVVAGSDKFNRLVQLGDLQIKHGHGDTFSYGIITSEMMTKRNKKG